MFVELKQKDLKPLRHKMWLENNKKCPVLDKEVLFEKTVVDHAHKRNNEEYSPTKGVVRACLDFRVNAILGKLENSLKRTGLENDDDFDLPTFLRNAADYFEKGAYIDENGDYLVHPNETKKEPFLKKTAYNKLKKVYNGKAKFPEYPRSKKLTKKLKSLFEAYEVKIEYYK